MGHSIQLQAGEGCTFSAYVAEPAGQPRAAVLVVQEIFGVNAHIRAVAESYAAEGYLALAPATFDRVQPGVELGYQDADMKVGMALKAKVEALSMEPHGAGVLRDLQAAIDWAARAGKVGMVGYCWGGLLTWRSACLLQGLSAAVPYYGGGITSATELARQPRCPVLAHFAEQDHWIPRAEINAFEHAHPEVQTYLYPAQHGFNCDHRSAWNADAARLARQRTLEHFARHLARVQ